MSNRGRHKTNKKEKIKEKYKGTWIFKAISVEEANYLLLGQMWDNNIPDLTVFEKKPYASKLEGGFYFYGFRQVNSSFDAYKIADKIHIYKKLMILT